MEIYIPLLKIIGYSFLAGIVISFFKSFKKKPSSWPIEIIANFLGSLLMFSGIVKAIDPLGTAYKMKDYFDAFSSFTGMDFSWLSDMSVFLAVFMIVLEIILGVAFIIGFKRKWTLSVTAAMMFFFLILTGFTYLTGFINPDFYDMTTRLELKATGEDFPVFVEYDELQMKVTDCGCFGDFLKLEPKVSFYKDIFLLIVIAVLFVFNKHIKPFFGSFFSKLKIGGTLLFFTLFCFSNYIWGLPLVDFRPYAIGNDINELRIEIPDKLDYGFIFKNVGTGELKRVVMSEYGDYSGNPEWEFTDKQDNIVLEKGVKATISNFGAYNKNGEDLTEDLLNNPDYSLWVLSKSLKKSKMKAWIDLNELSVYADENSMEMFGFMAVNFSEAEEFRHEHQITYPFYQADETFIKTVIRANPGLVLLKNGVVMGKWHHGNIPSKEEIAKSMKL